MMKPQMITRRFFAFLAGVSLAITTSSFAQPAWIGEPLEKAEPSDAQPCNWIEFHGSRANDALRIAFRSANPIDFNRGAAYCVYLDADNNRNTGFRGGGNDFPIGADYLLQGIFLFRYTGDGTGWAWTQIGEVPHEVAGNWASYTLNASLLPITGASVGAMLYGDNTAPGVGGNRVDVMPAGALRAGGGGPFIAIPAN
ncbi:MAG: hypothetical protein H3C50_08445 [Kiritimatiellae bacterium]|nr:hypothetical protein [Kiritimatiellia bacterium]MCO5061144.1 hypothetical protein [Kiritimatiellia bacterium]MCO5067794.1 hypothetical protein [Kiritimatiellia bacterium]